MLSPSKELLRDFLKTLNIILFIAQPLMEEKSSLKMGRYRYNCSQNTDMFITMSPSGGVFIVCKSLRSAGHGQHGLLCGHHPQAEVAGPQTYVQGSGKRLNHWSLMGKVLIIIRA